jgi:hypothetical protein
MDAKRPTQVEHTLNLDTLPPAAARKPPPKYVPKPMRSAWAVVFMVVLSFIATWSLLAAAAATLLGKSAIHEILAAVYFLTFTLAIVRIGIISTTSEPR